MVICEKSTTEDAENGYVHWGEHWLVSVTCVSKRVHIPWKNVWRRPPGCYWLLWNTPFDNQSKKSRQVCELSQRNEKMVLELLFGENRVLGHETLQIWSKCDIYSLESAAFQCGQDASVLKGRRGDLRSGNTHTKPQDLWANVGAMPQSKDQGCTPDWVFWEK